MSAPANKNNRPVTSAEELSEWMAEGCKSSEEWRIGTEHEKFGFHLDNLKPIEYGGDSGVRAMLEGMRRFGWQPIMEGKNIIGLEGADGAADGSITLEPSGQFELSGGTLKTLHQSCDEVHTHLHQVRTVADELGVGFLGIGFTPKWKRAEMPAMPKERYKLLTSYMAKQGSLGLDIMYRTCTIQVNLDFSSEADMVKKFRVALALQPVATALFANSPFTEGKPNGFLSYRAHAWTDTDPDRTGMLPFVFEDGFGFERYVDYVLDVPMHTVYRDGRYIDATAGTFRDYLAHRLPGLEDRQPVLGDWVNHLATIFPEARLKRFLEMRGADGGPWERLCALPALWVGILYHQPSLDAAYDMVRDWTEEERDDLRTNVARQGLATPFRKGRVQDLARDMVALAREGLAARGNTDGTGADEQIFLKPLEDTLATGRTPAEELLDKFHNSWGGSVDPVFKENAY